MKCILLCAFRVKKIIEITSTHVQWHCKNVYSTEGCAK